jgi:hypothetical protein
VDEDTPSGGAEHGSLVVRRRFLSSMSLRAVLAVGVVLAGYVLLHERFAAFDATLARLGLSALGFDVTAARPGDLIVRAGDDFDVYAIVTGSCSSAAGVLGLAAVSFVLLPGPFLRRAVGGLLAAALFMAFNLVRICSIIVLGWWFATGSRPLIFLSLLVPAAVALPFVLLPHRRLLLRVASFLVGGLAGVLAYQAWRGADFLDAMVSYHALAGPMLTFGALAIGIVLLWWTLVSRPGGTQKVPPDALVR